MAVLRWMSESCSGHYRHYAACHADWVTFANRHYADGFDVDANCVTHWVERSHATDDELVAAGWTRDGAAWLCPEHSREAA